MAERESADWVFDYGEEHSALMTQFWFLAVQEHAELPDCCSDFLFVSREGFVTGYKTKRQKEKSAREGLRFLEAEKRRAMEKDYADAVARFDVFIADYKKIESRLNELPETKLWKLFEKYCSNCVDVESFFRLSAGRALPLVEKHLKDELAGFFPANEIGEKYSLLLTPTTIGVLQREQADLMHLAKKESVDDAEIFAHASKYALHFYNTYDREQVKAFTRRRVEEERKLGKTRTRDAFLEEITAEKKKVESARKRIEEKLPPELVDLAAFLRHQGSFRFEVKDYWAGAEYRFLSLFEEIARRIGVSVETLFAAFLMDDFKKFLLEGELLDAAEIERRKKIFLFVVFGGKQKFLSGEAAEREAARLIGEDDESGKTHLTEFKGLPASPGVVEGRVRIVEARGLSELDSSLSEFQDGEILVTTMTQPNMVFLMKRAAAVVTDMGGMVSHAAIVSREFGVPCVVGARGVSKFLKTGDLVVVDANKGTVKKV